MNLLELKNFVDEAIENAAIVGKSPADITISTQITIEWQEEKEPTIEECNRFQGYTVHKKGPE